MVVNKRKKHSRLRGSHTHGWGSKKKHRGSGNRGGKGMAGTGKRADHMKPLYWKERYLGKFGFKMHGVVKPVKTINIGDIEESLEKLIATKFAVKEHDSYSVDLDKLGFNKLLGSGTITRKLTIKVQRASEQAIAKVREGGGDVILLNTDKKEGQ